MNGVDYLGGAIGLRKQGVLADVALSRRRAAATRVRTGEAYDSDVKALDDEMSALHMRIVASAKSDDPPVGMAGLLADHAVLVSSWRAWLSDQNYDENLKKRGWFVSSKLSIDEEKVFDDYKARERAFEGRFVSLKTGAPLSVPKVPDAPYFDDSYVDPSVRPLPPVERPEMPAENVAVTGSSEGTFVVMLLGAVAIIGFLAFKTLGKAAL